MRTFCELIYYVISKFLISTRDALTASCIAYCSFKLCLSVSFADRLCYQLLVWAVNCLKGLSHEIERGFWWYGCLDLYVERCRRRFIIFFSSLSIQIEVLSAVLQNASGYPYH